MHIYVSLSAKIMFWMIYMKLSTSMWWSGDNALNVWLTEAFLFSLKWVIKFSFKWVTSCRSYVRFISLFWYIWLLANMLYLLPVLILNFNIKCYPQRHYCFVIILSLIFILDYVLSLSYSVLIFLWLTIALQWLTSYSITRGV
jgi:hypothetical protein